MSLYVVCKAYCISFILRKNIDFSNKKNTFMHNVLAENINNFEK